MGLSIKKYREEDVLSASKRRISIIFDDFKRVCIAFSGGKDSTVLVHLVMDEAIKRGRTVGLMFIDMEAQYRDTIRHIENIFDLYKDHVDPHWICVPMMLRNAVSNFEPQWCAWDPDKESMWVREKPKHCKRESDYPFCLPKMEFEEFVPLFGEWYGQGDPCAQFIAIRADESLHRYCAIATWDKVGLMHKDQRWTTRKSEHSFNVYPIYDWRTEDIWRYHSCFPDKPHNEVYDKMFMAGVKISQQRLCQPDGDDQRRGLWLYHILEPDTWFKLVNRVNGANSGAMYVQENGNVSGYNKISKPDGHTWKSFCNLLLQTMPTKTREHCVYRFKKFSYGWRQRGYESIPDESPPELESKCWAPSWRRMCKVLLRNDYWCKSLGQAQPKSEAYEKFKALKRAKKDASQKAR